MLKSGSKVSVSIASAAVISLAVFQAFVSPATLLVANTSSSGSISSPVSVPEEVPSATPSPTPTPTPTPSNDPISTPVNIPDNSGNNGNGGSNGGGSSDSGNSGGGGGAACNDAKPGSAPVLYAATPSGPNKVTLRWLKAKDPVTYYAVTYGLTPGKQQYGNAYVGGANTTSYTVTHLSGGAAYYFKVRAGNGCTPGDYSSELSNKASGQLKLGPAANFKPGVLGTAKVVKPTSQASNTPESKVEATPAPKAQNNVVVNFFKSFVNFFSN